MFFDIFLDSIVSFRVDVKTPDDMRENDMRQSLKETLQDLYKFQGIRPVQFSRVLLTPPSKLFSLNKPPILHGGVRKGTRMPPTTPFYNDQKKEIDYDGLRERVSSSVPFPILLQECSLREALEAQGEKFHESE